jgi:hypothetical protein
VSPLTEELSKALHDVSFGVVDIANRIYLAAQVKAIETEAEVITEGMLRSAYRDDFRLISRIIECLESGDPALLERFRDVVIKPAAPVKAGKTQSKSDSTKRAAA